MSPRFFSYHSFFDWVSLIKVCPAITDELVQFLRQHPKCLRDLSPRKFEQLIAELWSKFGFTVEFTKRTRDGGRDIVAIRTGRNKVKYLIECKRYSEENTVGISVVHRLNGVVQLEGANKGIIATTSRFTQPAREVIDSTWYLEGRDIDGIADWLDVYQNIEMYRQLGLDLAGF